MVDDLTVARKLINTANSASKRGIAFNISFRKMKSLLKKKKCHYTGVLMNDADDNNAGGYVRSIDRVESNIGYIDSNVVVCTATFNSMKSNLSNEHLCSALNAIIKLRTIN